MQFFGQCLDFGEYVRKSPKKIFLLTLPLIKSERNIEFFLRMEVNISLVIQGFFASLCCLQLRRFNGTCLFIASAIVLTS